MSQPVQTLTSKHQKSGMVAISIPMLYVTGMTGIWATGFQHSNDQIKKNCKYLFTEITHITAPKTEKKSKHK